MILGTSAAVQANGRHQSAQFLRLNGHNFLIDCGEGTQEQLRKKKINNNKISKIFISHLHGDHFLGLFGLLSTMSLMGRDKKLHIFGPKGLKEIISTQLKYSQSYFSYPVELTETSDDAKNLLFEDDQISIYSFPLSHGITCTGFLFEEKTKPRKINLEKLPKEADALHYKMLKKGFDIELSDGTILKNKDYTSDPKKSFSYAYCSDTAYSSETAKHIQKCSILYHESTFLENQKDKAIATNHSTAKDAAQVALESKTAFLLLGHFSARYNDEKEFEQEAQTVFKNCEASIEGKFYVFDELLGA
jgi:ribonuclease Z